MQWILNKILHLPKEIIWWSYIFSLFYFMKPSTAEFSKSCFLNFDWSHGTRSCICFPVAKVSDSSSFITLTLNEFFNNFWLDRLTKKYLNNFCEAKLTRFNYMQRILVFRKPVKWKIHIIWYDLCFQVP